MTTGTGVAPQKKEKSIVARVGWAVLIVATLYACYFSHLGAFGFVGPDEPRYAWIAREMAESGDWVTPRLYGKPWFEKPPLYYWGAAIGFKLFGVNETAARLPSAISALLATIALAWLAWRIYGSETARWVPLLLPTTVGMIGFSHAASMDMPFAGTLAISMVLAAVVLGLVPERSYRNQAYLGRAQYAAPLQRDAANRDKAAWSGVLLLGFFLGLAVLAKGPAAIILCGGAVFLWALLTKRWRDALRLLHPAAIGAFCLTALPWYILCARRNPDFFRVFFIEHNFKRYLTPEFQHIQPFWFYVPLVLGALLPWTLLLFPAINEVRQSLRQPAEPRASAIFQASWALFVCVFFSFSQSKLPGYILPAIPPLIVLCTLACTRLIASKSRLSRVVLAGTCVVAIIAMAIGIAYALGLLRVSDVREVASYFPLGLPIAGAALLVVLLLPTLPLTRYPVACVLGIVLALGILLCFTPLSRLDSAVSTRQSAEAIARVRKPGEEVLVCDIRRSYAYGLSFYLHQEAKDWSQRDPQKPALVVIGSPACWSELTGIPYHERQEEFARWPLIELEPGSAAASSSRGQPQ